MDALIALVLIVAMFAILGAGVWIGIAVLGVAWIGMELFTTRPGGDALALTVWGLAVELDPDGAAAVHLDGRDPAQDAPVRRAVRGLAPWLQRVPGRLLHVNIVGCTIFAAVSGSSAATCATIGQDVAAGAEAARLSGDHVGRLAGRRRHAGAAHPPSIIMIVYGVAADVSIGKLFIAGIVPGLMLAGLFMCYTTFWSLRNPGAIPPADAELSFRGKLAESRHLIPVMLLIMAVLGSIYAGIATATEAAPSACWDRFWWPPPSAR